MANAQLLNQADDTDRKTCDLTKHVEEVDARFFKLTVDHGKSNEELCQVRAFEEGFQKLSEMLEAQLSMLKDAQEKLVVDLESLRTRCDRYRHGYYY